MVILKINNSSLPHFNFKENPLQHYVAIKNLLFFMQNFQIESKTRFWVKPNPKPALDSAMNPSQKPALDSVSKINLKNSPISTLYQSTDSTATFNDFFKSTVTIH